MKAKLKRAALVMFTVVLVLIVSACGGDGGGGGGTDSNAEGGTGEVFTFTANYHGPNTIAPGMGMVDAVKKVEEDSGGRIKITPYFDGTYVAYDESIQATINDVVDICYVDAGNLNEVFYANRLLSAPLKCDIPSWDGAHTVMNQILEQIPEIAKELEDVGLVWIGIGSYGGSVLHLKNDQVVTKPEQLKGMSINTAADATALLGSCGAEATNTSATEFYTVLERGIVDGWLHNWGAFNSFKCVEVTKAHTVFTSEENATQDATGLWSAAGGYVMNKEKYDSLPDDLKQVIKESFGDYAMTAWGDYEKPNAEQGFEAAKAAGHTITYLDQEQLLPWKDAIAQSVPSILDACKKDGIDSYAIYDKICELMQAQYDKEHA
ncbi:MAG: TRAP transporter substrate-binding protein DctP [Clostridiales Family XIII bacterium]|jgi:TRAP-type C4-dicarboxylate transport system substrate-binding protein|nr:TRAP transporter substrate-binding protein DctP [Clostridiales Family XIII bacterium]